MSEPYDDTIWGAASYGIRSDVKENVYRVYEMGMIGTTGGTEPGQHANTTTSVFNNKRSIDWAIWKLLVSLRDAGYNAPPQ